jgi:hypothetical protein
VTNARVRCHPRALLSRRGRVAKTLTSFEVPANPIAPGVPDVPYVQQGFFLQVSNLGTTSALVGIEYVASPAFVESNGAIKLFTNIIDETGMPQ